MSCLKPGYNPNPARAWNRVQHPCTYEPISTPNASDPIYIPALKKFVPYSEVGSVVQMLYKGNILQYKDNSSNLTKNQRYAKVARGRLNGRTTSWATQSDKYTQPNTRFFKRVNILGNILLDGTPTDAPITCDPNTPQDQIVVENGGTLVCKVQYNPCTGETKVAPPRELCFPTTCSDVPGNISLLCYNDSVPTYFPRYRYKMGSSGDKWPQGYKGLKSGNDTPSL
jgi:hypothetical protein